MSRSEQRLEALEIKTMDLEQSVADLNDVIIQQYQIIDNLQRRVDKLTYQVESSGEDAQNPAVDPPPPHY